MREILIAKLANWHVDCAREKFDPRAERFRSHWQHRYEMLPTVDLERIARFYLDK